jgi:hypothetical protein
MAGQKPIKSSQGTPPTPVQGHLQEVVIVEPNLLPKSSTEKLLSPTFLTLGSPPPRVISIETVPFFSIESLCNY